MLLPVRTAVCGPAQPRLELAERDVEGGELVLGRCLGADDGALAAAGQLHPVGPVGQSRVELLGDLDIDTLERGVESLDLAQLLVGRTPEPFRDLHVTALDDDVHETSL